MYSNSETGAVDWQQSLYLYMAHEHGSILKTSPQTRHTNMAEYGIVNKSDWTLMVIK